MNGFARAALRVSCLFVATLGAFVETGDRSRAQQAPGPDAPLARYVGADDLIAVVEFDGLRHHQAVWKATALHDVLSTTTTGAMLRSLLTQLVDVGASRLENAPITGADAARLFDHLSQHGFIAAIHRPVAGSGLAITFVVRGAGEPTARDSFERVIRAMVPAGGITQTIKRQDGRILLQSQGGANQPGWMVWAEEADLVLVANGDDREVDRLVAAIAPGAKNLATHPLRQALARVEGAFTPIAWGWVDTTGLPPMPPESGLSGLKRLDFQWGFDKRELVGISHVVAPKPRSGLLSLLDQPAIEAGNMPPIPAGTLDYAIASFNLARAHDVLEPLFTKVAPNGTEIVNGFHAGFTQSTGMKLREDVLDSLGSRWAFFVEPRSIPAPLTPINALGAGFTRIPPVHLVGEVNDAGKLKNSLTALGQALNPRLAELANGAPKPIQLVGLNKALGLRLDVPPQLLPLPTSIDPGMVHDSKYLVISNHVASAQGILGLQSDTGRRLVPDLRPLPPGLIYLEVHDPRAMMPDLIANLPFFVHVLGRTGPGFPVNPPPADNPFSTIEVDRALIPDPESIRGLLAPGSVVATVDDDGLTIVTRDTIPTLSVTNSIPIALGLLLPAMQSAREAAQRSQSTNNMRQIALAMHNGLDANGERFPDDIRDADGKPLLSWRVAILPYLEQGALYDQFKLDEPWDSPNNKPLLAMMPKTYASPGGRSGTPADHTLYQVLRGEGGIFEPNQAAKISEIADGTSNTIFFVEAGAAVPWTKPADVNFEPEKPLPALGGMRWARGYNAAFADGSVRFLSERIAPAVLKALISRQGGEVIAPEDLSP